MEPGKLPEVRDVGDVKCEWEELLGGDAGVMQMAEDLLVVHLKWGRLLGLPLNFKIDIAPMTFGDAPVEREIGLYGPVLFLGAGPEGPCDIDDRVGLLIMSGRAFGREVQDAELDG